MPVIPKVGRKHPKIVALIGVVYAILIVGGLTMVYPFALMVSQSVSGPTDYRDYRLIPEYLTDDEAMYGKFLYERYNADIKLFNLYHLTNYFSWEDMREELGRLVATQRLAPAAIRDYQQFLKQLPLDRKDVCYYQALQTGVVRASFLLEHEYRQYLRGIFEDDIDKLNERYASACQDFVYEVKPYEDMLGHAWIPDEGPKVEDWLRFKESREVTWLRPLDLCGLYRQFLMKRYRQLAEDARAEDGSGSDVTSGAKAVAQRATGGTDAALAILNSRWGTDFRTFEQINLPPTVPADTAHAADWLDFVRQQYPARLVRLTSVPLGLWRDLLKRQHDHINRLNIVYGSQYASFDEVPAPLSMPTRRERTMDFLRYIEKHAPVETITLFTTRDRYIDFLRHHYGTIEQLNTAHEAAYSDFDAVLIPYEQMDYEDMLSLRGGFLRHFVVGNYRQVFSTMAGQDRALFNTLILIVMMVVGMLTINPLCAYALSRFQLSYGNRILIYLLAPMAFPGEVTMITNFLQIKELGLLNTYWGLILPALASGFSIFLLKGFFDSLPEELYEAAVLEGAGEMTMFRKITIPLSKPILAVIALQAFTAAYGIYLWAIIICQDQAQWPLMVFLQQLQQIADPPVVMASLVLAALPTLIVFIFAQRVIMRGIVIPQLK